MFDIGWPELLLILIVALVLFGPNRLPELARSIGKSVNAFKQGLREGVKEDETKEVKEEVKQ
jgi:TatA/E family protein of Tat protein translocase